MGACTDKNIGKNIDRYLLDLLSTQEIDQFEQHILECEFCAAEAANFSETSAHLLHSDDIKAEVEKIVAADGKEDFPKTDQTRTQGHYPWWKRRVVWAAAAILLILLARPWKIDISPSNDAIAVENKIAVMPFTSNETQEKWLGNAATNLLTTRLSEFSKLAILNTQHITNIIGYLNMQKIKEFDADMALRVAEKADANWVIIGNIGQSDPDLFMNVILLNAQTGDTVTNMNLTGKAANDLFSIIDKMTDTLSTDILRNQGTAQSSEPSISDITTRSPEAYRQYLNGVSFFEQLYSHEAESCFVKAISYDSTFAMAYYSLAYIRDEKENIESALKYIKRSGRQEQYYIRALAFLINNDTDGFFNEIAKLVKDFPLDAKAYYWYAQIQNRLGNKQVALDYFRRSIAIDPYYKLAYNNMSYIFMDLNDYEKALWANDMYIAISPDEANPYDTRGDIYAKMGEFEEAIESYLKTMQIKPFFGFTYSKLGELYQLTRNFEQARYWEHEGWNNEHDSPFPANIDANMYAAEGKFNQAITTLDEALPLVKKGIMKSVTTSEIIQAKARILAEKDPLLSIKEMETILEVADTLPEFPKANFNNLYTRLLIQSGNLERADSILEQLKQDIDTTTLSQYSYYFISGCIDLRRKLYENAVLHLRQACDIIGPNHDFESRYLLAVSCIESGQFDRAVSELTRQLKSESYMRVDTPMWNAKMYYHLGRAYEGQGKYHLASEQYEYFLKIWGNADWQINEIEDAKIRLARLNNRS